MVYPSLSIRAHDKSVMCFVILRHVVSFLRLWNWLQTSLPWFLRSGLLPCWQHRSIDARLESRLTCRSSGWIAMFVSLCFFTKYGSHWKILNIDTSLIHLLMFLFIWIFQNSMNLHITYPEASPSQPSDVTFPVRGDRRTWRCRSVWSRRPAQIHLMAFHRHIVTWSCKIHHFDVQSGHQL